MCSKKHKEELEDKLILDGGYLPRGRVNRNILKQDIETIKNEFYDLFLKLLDPKLKKAQKDKINEVLKKIKTYLNKHDPEGFKNIQEDLKVLVVKRKELTHNYVDETAGIKKEIKSLQKKMITKVKKPEAVKKQIWEKILAHKSERAPTISELFNDIVKTKREIEDRIVDKHEDAIIDEIIDDKHDDVAMETDDPAPSGGRINRRRRRRTLNPRLALYIKTLRKYRQNHPEVPFREAQQIVKQLIDNRRETEDDYDVYERR